MTDSSNKDKDSNIEFLEGTLLAAARRAQNDNPTKGLVIYFSDDPVNPELERISIQYSGNMQFKDFTALQFALSTWIGQQYYG